MNRITVCEITSFIKKLKVMFMQQTLTVINDVGKPFIIRRMRQSAASAGRFDSEVDADYCE